MTKTFFRVYINKDKESPLKPLYEGSVLAIHKQQVLDYFRPKYPEAIIAIEEEELPMPSIRVFKFLKDIPRGR